MCLTLTLLNKKGKANREGQQTKSTTLPSKIEPHINIYKDTLPRNIEPQINSYKDTLPSNIEPHIIVYKLQT
jgi:hypothetical protein